MTTLPGINENTAVKIISEIGTDMSRWASSKHFASWLGLCPGNNISGGKILSSHTKPINNRVAQALRMAASTLYNSDTALGAYMRRLGARIGKYKAITATAHKLAVYIYHMLKIKKNYYDVGGAVYEKRYKERVLSNMAKKANEFGYDLVKRRDDAAVASHVA